jgi:hypothetical protein
MVKPASGSPVPLTPDGAVPLISPFARAEALIDTREQFFHNIVKTRPD